jgi:hypothetical protein
MLVARVVVRVYNHFSARETQCAFRSQPLSKRAQPAQVDKIRVASVNLQQKVLYTTEKPRTAQPRDERDRLSKPVALPPKR